MNSLTGILIIIIYFILSVFYTLRELIFIYKENDIHIISFVRFMYALIYGVIPCIVHGSYYFTGNVVTRINYNETGVDQLVVLIFLSILGYISINLGYSLNVNKKKQKNDHGKINNLFLAGVICLLIGFVSILIWTNVYGSPIEIIQYADLIRSGYEPIYNPYAFMKHFSSLVLFASYLFFAAIQEQTRLLNRFINGLFLLVAGLLSVSYIVANDGRMLAVIYFAIFLLAKFTNDLHNKKTTLRNIVIKFGLLSIVSLIAISKVETLLYYFKYGIWGKEASANLLEILRNEFGYTIISGQTALTVINNSIYEFRIFEDLISGLLAWVPSRYTTGIFVTLFDFNTSFISGVSGQIPTGIISMSLYDLGIMGVFIIPFLFGYFIKIVEGNFQNKLGQTYYDVLYMLVAFYFLKAVSYCDLNNIMRNIFFIVVGHLIVKVVNIRSSPETAVLIAT